MTVWTSTVAESIIYGVDSHKVGHIRCHRQNIGILTSDTASTWKLVLVTYNMSYYGMVSVVPFLVIIIVFAPARTVDQIWWCPLQIPHFCGISHLLTYKLSLVEQGVRSPPNNLYYLIYYYLTINLNDVQITWRTPWLKSDWTLMSGLYPHYILWHWIAFSPLRLDPYWKLVLNAYTYVPIPKITKLH